MFPFESLATNMREVGLVVTVLIGFGFGFVLERAGFGRSSKLAAQFYGTDMTVFKVMFGAIVTAMLGMVLLDGLGVVSLHGVGEGAVSATYIWPMAVGGFALGAGFIISGYCPGTSIVATASGNFDGLVTLVGVAIGAVLYGELYPLVQSFAGTGDKGLFFIYQWLDIPPAWVALIITGIAVGGFIGAEAVERLLAKRRGAEVPTDQRPAPKRYAFGLYAAVAVVALMTLAFPVEQTALARGAGTIAVETLAKRILEKPWKVRVVDVRPRKACVEKRIPGSECVPVADLDKLGLAYVNADRDLVLVGAENLTALPAAAASYRGDVLTLNGGFAAWKTYALNPPEPPAAGATPEEVADYRLRAGLHSKLTGQVAAPPPPTAVKAFIPKKKKKGGGCE